MSSLSLRGLYEEKVLADLHDGARTDGGPPSLREDAADGRARRQNHMGSKTHRLCKQCNNHTASTDGDSYVRINEKLESLGANPPRRSKLDRVIAKNNSRPRTPLNPKHYTIFAKDCSILASQR